ncbi:phosphoheptose isomerase [Propionigenium maris DSM 9537]|uniref:Phosphoheptose isomerase n=1 Tax=Propionigenium maris DSM 9537 TaxID=1123000 RepID=A0A9W6LLW9_9FUSO|nr:D-sedoheptulose 7-phosphate isomerase [Propionigenium maris]GLI55726.1 phosphoheptose isomerase [Propionigenium maris DSM 9537]
MNLIDSYVTTYELLKDFIEIERKENITEKIAVDMAAAFQAGNKVLIAGNGGSNCDALHFSEEFTGRFRGNRRALPAISLSDSSHITCVGNDFGFDYIFSRGVEAYGKEGDFFIGLSTSGNSANVIKAVEAAKELGMKTIVLLGKDGGKLKGMCDYEFVIPGATSDRIQEIHMMILHIIIEGVEKIMFPENY